MKLTETNYFSKDANMEYMSASQIKSFLKCEACALAELKGDYARPRSAALLEGSLADVILTGTKEEYDKFIEENAAELISSRGATKGNFKSNFQKVLNAVDKFKSCDFMMKSLSGEHQVIMTGEIAGSPIKIKIDSLLPTSIVDLKTCENIHKHYWKDGARVSFIENFDYVTQGAIYQEIVRQNTGKKLPFFLACVSKQEQPELGFFNIDDDTLATRLEELVEIIPYFQGLKNGDYETTSCGRCGYCLSKQDITVAQDWREIELD